MLRFLAFALVVHLPLSAAIVLPLIPIFSKSYPVQLDQLLARDQVRHAQVFKNIVAGAVNISSHASPLAPSIGLYLTKLKLGSPPREFDVLFDTGSDLLWVSCNPCNGCPRSSELGIELNFYNYASSSTAGLIPCSHPMCSSSIGSGTKCSHKSKQCTYDVKYDGGDRSSGYYVSDELYFDMITRQFNSSALVVFGCTTYESGLVTHNDIAFNGILGFGLGDLSIISQLSSRGIIPNVFSHCLKRDGNSGGILALGEVLEPSIMYSPLVPSQHYSLHLQSIAVNGQILPIDPAVFTSHGRATVVDSGTTMGYLVEEAYGAFITAITLALPKSVTTTMSDETLSYLVSTSLAEAFPPVSLNFAGGASMLLKPEDYLVYIRSYNGVDKWSMGFKKSRGGITILGDLVLKDKIVVYDVARQRLGWANYDCSLPVNISVTVSENRGTNWRHRSGSSSLGERRFKWLTTGILLMHIWVHVEF